MPQQVIRDGKTYYEYTPQELEAIRNKQIGDRYARNGQFKFASSIHEEQNGKLTGHKKNRL